MRDKASADLPSIRESENSFDPGVNPGIKGVYWISLILVISGIAVLPFDGWLTNPERLKFLPGDAGKVIGLTELFAHGFGVFVIAMGIWLMVPQAIRFIPRIAACAFWPAIVVHGLKSQFGRFRPIRYFDEHSVFRYPENIADTWMGWLPYDKINTVYTTQSFPSAHTATTWGLALGMCWVFPKGRWLFVAIAILASMQRVVSYAHWPSDVFFGAAIAFCFGGALLQNWGLGAWLGRLENRSGDRKQGK